MPLRFRIKSSSGARFLFVRHYARSGFAFTEKPPSRFRSTHVEQNAQSMLKIGFRTISQHISKCAESGWQATSASPWSTGCRGTLIFVVYSTSPSTKRRQTQFQIAIDAPSWLTGWSRENGLIKIWTGRCSNEVIWKQTCSQSSSGSPFRTHF